MTNYFNRRKKQKLYRQWVEKSGLPPESIPGDIEPANVPDGPVDEDGGFRRPDTGGGPAFRLTMRYFLYLLFIAIVLLVSTATLATILIMRSC
jgi:hypothetical protein